MQCISLETIIIYHFTTAIMHTISLILVVLSALLFLYIFILETLLTNSQRTAKTFRMSVDELSGKSLNTLMKNQGVYNALIGVGLLYGAFVSHNTCEVSMLFLSFAVLVAVYGAISSQWIILIKQGELPILALLSLILFGWSYSFTSCISAYHDQKEWESLDNSTENAYLCRQTSKILK